MYTKSPRVVNYPRLPLAARRLSPLALCSCMFAEEIVSNSIYAGYIARQKMFLGKEGSVRLLMVQYRPSLCSGGLATILAPRPSGDKTAGTATRGRRLYPLRLVPPHVPPQSYRYRARHSTQRSTEKGTPQEPGNTTLLVHGVIHCLSATGDPPQQLDS
ncbi:hypothetical protein P167DRAFT_577530 [Morchella conica CCBAS932]|uniref:Uncharacterized protein n=1 Tax=Morchella conica CCBAS932 TaxID=1392247 RepID=A0A3N4KTW8_9PEZI|nr:hypothetical protein P167DRAFT_577530 [Morchella conica CCBAS932]